LHSSGLIQHCWSSDSKLDDSCKSAESDQNIQQSIAFKLRIP
jgi:hypothetical protein